MGKAPFLLRVACFVLAWCPCAFALNPALDVSQYAHTSWNIRDGFFKGRIVAMAQTPDGYLWLGTEFGLVRFDGVRFVPWQPPAGHALPATFIRSLLVARDGALWIGTLDGVARWKDGTLTRYPGLAGLGVSSIVEDRAGTIWVSGVLREAGRLCAVHSGRVECHRESGTFGRWSGSLYVNADGLWMAAETGLWHWTREAPKSYPLPMMASSGLQALTGRDDDGLLIVTRNSITRFVDGRTEAFRLPATRLPVKPFTLQRDRDGGLWIGTSDRGLVHVSQGRADLFMRSDGLSSDVVYRTFEDREGNIWVATVDGLDRFREVAVPTISEPQGLSTAAARSLLATPDGNVWINTGGLNLWNSAQRTVRPIAASALTNAGSLFQGRRGRIWVSTLGAIGYIEDGRFMAVVDVPADIVNAIAEDARGNLWFLTLKSGLLRLSPDHQVQRIPWSTFGRNDYAIRLAVDRARGGFWLGFARGGVLLYVDGQIRESYGDADGLGKGEVNDLFLDREATVWAATPGGLSRVKNGRVATLTTAHGLPCDRVDSMIADDANAYWLYMECGFVRLARAELDAWAAAVDTNQGSRTIQATVFDSSDGVRSVVSFSSYSPRLARSPDGRLWFAGPDGVSVLDPRDLPVNRLAPPVHIEQIIADRTTYDAASIGPDGLRLPPLTRDLQIDYTALSFVAPEKMQFRYKLENRDTDWQSVGTRRQAFYDNLPPGTYRFRVIASNNDGVWNDAGANLAFVVAPAYYQTVWFRIAVAAACVALLGAAYRYRVRRVARDFNMRLEARVDERLRIARDFHDTLLQSFQGVLLKFQAAAYLLPNRPEEARTTLESVIDQASVAISEGRDAVQGLRGSMLTATELAPAIGLLGQQFAADYGGPQPPDLRVAVEGTPRDLSPLVRDEVYRIGGEALRNAFRHAAATRIEVEVHYDPRRFRLRVRDNGKGIDPAVLAVGGRDRHFGLAGMHERAQLVGGKLAVWSERDSGSEIELTVPAAVAFAKSAAVRR